MEGKYKRVYNKEKGSTKGQWHMQELTNVLQSNLIGVFLMIITLFSLRKNRRSGIIADRLFFLLALFVLVVCDMEILATAFNRQTFTGASELNRFFNAVLFAVNPIPAFLWGTYAHCKIYDDEKKLKRASKFLVIPLVIVVVLSFANLFTDVFFSITADNVYMREKGFFLSTCLSVFYIVYVIIIAVWNRKNIEKNLFFPLLSFMVLPVVGLTLQILFMGMYMLWVSVAISVIIVFNHVQNDYAITDWLTGLYNRKYLDTYLQQMYNRKPSSMLVGLMIDVDRFKSINDSFGHLTGDNALRDTAKILKRGAGKKAKVSRYAGDEFVIVLAVENEAEISRIIQRIEKTASEFNQTSGKPYKLEFSIGYAIFKIIEGQTPDDFLYQMDQSMYWKKNAKKARKL